MIPKTIHWVWVGKNPIPKDLKRCMRTWKKHLKDYEFKLWNEDNFDINSHPFCKKAYENKKWAFVSDYIRLYALYNEGGIYIDTDVIVLDNFDKYLNHRLFAGFESENILQFGILGAEKNHPLLKILLDKYDNMEFTYNNENEFKNANVYLITDTIKNKYNYKQNNTYQELDDGIVLYKDDVFCNPSENSTVIHIYSGTWLDKPKNAISNKIVKFLKLRLTNKRRASLYKKIIKRR